MLCKAGKHPRLFTITSRCFLTCAIKTWMTCLAFYTALAGVPTVCAMGVKGGRNHSPEEYAIVETLFERAKLLIACVLKLDPC